MICLMTNVTRIINSKTDRDRKKEECKRGCVILLRMWVIKEEEWMDTELCYFYTKLAILIHICERHNYRDVRVSVVIHRRIRRKKVAFQSAFVQRINKSARKMIRRLRLSSRNFWKTRGRREIRNVVWTGSLVTASCQADLSSSLILYTTVMFSPPVYRARRNWRHFKQFKLINVDSDTVHGGKKICINVMQK